MDKMFRVAGAAIVAAILLAAGAPAPSATNDPAALPDKREGLRVYHIGNSHTHSVRNVLMPLAVAAGHPRHTYSWSSILGAPLRWIWDHDKDSGGWEAEIWSKGLAPDRAWDALTLQTYAADDREVECAVKFAELAYGGNPRCQVYLYTIWPSARDDWERPPPERTEAVTERCAAAIAKAFPDAPPPRVLPTSLVMRELGRLADAGQLPHVANRFALLSDGGHLSDYGNYAVNVTFCAMLYDESPLGYPNRIGGYRRQDREVKEVDLAKVQYEIPAETADCIKQVVWDVLATYPPARMNVGLTIADRSIPPVIAGQKYKHELKALNAAAPVRWWLLKGSLPEGLTLSPGGLLAGTTDRQGRFPITVGVTDGRQRAERALALAVSPDVAPTVVAQDLTPVPLDQYVFLPLKVEGGVAPLGWSLAGGRLPRGAVITRTGILVGTPGEAGCFGFTVRVSDSHPAGPRSHERALQWQVGPASPQALLVRRVAEPPVLDGKLDEPFWKLDQAIAKCVEGSPKAKAVFAAVWHQPQKGRAAGKGAVYLAVRVTDGSAAAAARTAIDVFIDAMHNREVVYNADDTHLRIARDGRATTIRGRPWWFLKTAVGPDDAGYFMEIMIPESYFYSGLDFGPGAVYGLDLALVEGDKQQASQVWRGTARNGEDTSSFGSIVLVDEESSAPAADP